MIISAKIKKTVRFLCFTILLSSSVAASAASGDSLPPETTAYMCGNKLLRGLTNAATGSGELGRQIVMRDETQSDFVSVPVGFFAGVLMTVVRTGYGAVETATFLIPVGGDYSSLLKPAYVWGPKVKPDDSN